MDYGLLLAVIGGLAILLGLILWLRIPAFISLLISSVITGIFTGLAPNELMSTIQKGMGSTLGFVATVVGLGAIFGGILEKSGGAQVISRFLLRKLGQDRAPLAMVLTGFVIAIPVFFDVAFIILIPVIYALQKASGKSLLLYAIPLLAGLAVTHAFIPPTPGPIAVADIIGVDLGWVILGGFLVGVPTAIISGLFFGKYIAKKIHLGIPESMKINNETYDELPSIGMILAIILVPIILILLKTSMDGGLFVLTSGSLMYKIIAILGHPFSALIIANLLAWYLLGIGRGYTNKELTDISMKSVAPTGLIILLTGAGGTFKQILVDSGAGEAIATSFADMGMPIIVFAFVSATIIRIVQGSATVAMITAAGLVAPTLVNSSFSGMQLSAITIAIASGASIFSHVNDSGFWLVKEYLGMTEKQTFSSWTVMTSILAICGFLGAMLLYTLA